MWANSCNKYTRRKKERGQIMENYAKIILNNGHCLIAGTTGAGKSTAIHGIIYEGVKMSPTVARFVLIDLKRVELNEWKTAPHCLNYINKPEQVAQCLNAYIKLMEDRFAEMEKNGQNETPYTHIYIIIDELADIISTCPSAVYLIAKICRLGRAAHLHIIAATQSPDRRTIPAIIQQNITTSLALRCKTRIESRQTIGIAGAENLPKHGEAILWDANGYRKIKIPYITPEERKQARAKLKQ